MEKVELSRQDFEIGRTQGELQLFAEFLADLKKQNKIPKSLEKVTEEEFRFLQIFAHENYLNSTNYKFNLSPPNHEHDGFIFDLKSNIKTPIQITCCHISKQTKNEEKELKNNGFSFARKDIPLTVPIDNKFNWLFSELKRGLNNKARRIKGKSKQWLLIGIDWTIYTALEPDMDNLTKLIHHEFLNDDEILSDIEKFQNVSVIGLGKWATCHHLKLPPRKQTET